MEEIASLYKFYGWWQIVVGLFAFVALLSIWQHITKDQEQGQKDYGLLWLCFAVLAWALTGVVDIAYAGALNTSALDAKEQVFYKGLRSILSMSNSALILLALPCFKHIPKVIYHIIKSQVWRFVVITTFTFSSLLTALMFLEIIVPAKPAFIATVDLIYAIFTLVFLGLILWASFENRGLKAMAYLTASCIAFTLVAQVLKIYPSDFWRLCFDCIFKTILIMLFFALALSWVQELAKDLLAKPEEMHIVFLQKKNMQGKFEFSTILTVPPMIQTQQVFFTEKPFELFLKFAQKSITAPSEKEAWLEIQPKSVKTGQYDIKDYNQINRILDNILNETKGPNNWNIEEDRHRLKQALFAYQKNRKVKLRVASENITMKAG